LLLDNENSHISSGYRLRPPNEFCYVGLGRGFGIFISLRSCQ
jgi:hypothetical protein